MSVRGRVLASRTGYAGELRYEVFVHPSQATEVWDAIWEATPGLVSCPAVASAGSNSGARRCPQKQDRPPPFGDGRS